MKSVPTCLLPVIFLYAVLPFNPSSLCLSHRAKAADSVGIFPNESYHVRCLQHHSHSNGPVSIVQEVSPLSEYSACWWLVILIALLFGFCASLQWLHGYLVEVMVDPLKIFWVLTNSTYLGKVVSPFSVVAFAADLSNAVCWKFSFHSIQFVSVKRCVTTL